MTQKEIDTNISYTKRISSSMQYIDTDDVNVTIRNDACKYT